MSVIAIITERLLKEIHWIIISLLFAPSQYLLFPGSFLISLNNSTNCLVQLSLSARRDGTYSTNEGGISMAKSTKPMSANLAKELLNDKNVYLTEEGRRMLNNMASKSSKGKF